MATKPIPIPQGATIGEPIPIPEGAVIGEPTGVHESKISAAPKPFTMDWLKSKFYDIADKTSQGLPAAGATAGSLIGGGVGTGVEPGGGTVAGAIGGAGIGGMAGESLRQLIRRGLGFESPQTSQEAATGIAKEGAIQGGVQAASEALPMAAPFLRRQALGQYERALAPTTRINKAIVKDRAPEMMQRGLAGNLDFLANEATTNANQLKQPLDMAYEAVNPEATRGSGNSVLASLENMKNKYIVNGQVAQPQAVNAIEGVQDIVRQYGPDISPKSLRQLKQIFDEPVAAKGGYAGTDLATQYGIKAQKAAANSIRDILNQASPDVAALNREMSFWLDVKRVAEQSGLRRTGQEGGLVKSLAPLAGAAGLGFGVATSSAQHGAEGALAATLAALTAQAMKSPTWRTSSAIIKNQLADALASGNVGRVAALLGRFGVTVGEASKTPPK